MADIRTFRDSVGEPIAINLDQVMAIQLVDRSFGGEGAEFMAELRLSDSDRIRVVIGRVTAHQADSPDAREAAFTKFVEELAEEPRKSSGRTSEGRDGSVG